MTEPEGDESPVLVEIPHAGLALDAETLSTLVAPARCVGRDADLFVDRLYADAPSVGSSLLVAHTSRYVVDLNRAETDVDGESVWGMGGPHRASRGVVWRLTSDGLPALAHPLPRSEFERRLATYYHPYHRALRALLEHKIARFGLAVVLAAHSMPSSARTGHGDVGRTRADVVPGTQGRTSAASSFIDAVEQAARGAGLSVAHDEPYKGGFTTLHYGRPEGKVHVVQVELARRLYMDEATLREHEGFPVLKRFCTGMVAGLVARARAFRSR